MNTLRKVRQVLAIVCITPMAAFGVAACGGNKGGAVGAVEREVGRVEIEVGLAGRDTARVADRPCERGAQLLDAHFSRGCQEKRLAATT